MKEFFSSVFVRHENVKSSPLRVIDGLRAFANWAIIFGHGVLYLYVSWLVLSIVFVCHCLFFFFFSQFDLGLNQRLS
jgi:hypothetical protein